MGCCVIVEEPPVVFDDVVQYRNRLVIWVQVPPNNVAGLVVVCPKTHFGDTLIFGPGASFSLVS